MFENCLNLDFKILLKKLYNLGCRNLLIEGGDELTRFLLKSKIFNQFFLYKSPKNILKSSEYLKFSSFKLLKHMYKNKVILDSSFSKDRITLYKN